jgi:hypothetical protein
MITNDDCWCFVNETGMCYCEDSNYYTKKCPFSSVEQCPIHNTKARWR